MSESTKTHPGVVIHGVRFGSDHAMTGSASLGAAGSSASGVTKISVPLPKQRHDALKVYAIQNNTTITNLVLGLIEDLLDRQS